MTRHGWTESWIGGRGLGVLAVSKIKSTARKNDVKGEFDGPGERKLDAIINSRVSPRGRRC